MDKASAIAQLNTLIEEGKAVLSTSFFHDGVFGGPWVKSEAYIPWQAKAVMLLHEVLPEHQQKKVRLLEEKTTNHTSIAEEWQAQLQGTLDAIERGIIVLDSTERASDVAIERILESFPDVVDSINRRHDGRKGFPINDEYDVQDLLRSLCLALCNDVRDEEAVPSFAGKNSRVDLFLKEESRFIEVKMARDSSHAKKLGEELSIDIPQYKKHPGCNHLFCFIYDPNRFVRNPIGLKSDLEQVDPGFVTVIIAR